MNYSQLVKIFLVITLLFGNSCSNTFWQGSNNRKSPYKNDETAESFSNITAKSSPVRGWEYVIDILAKKGISKAYLTKTYSSNKMPYWTPISFKVKPKEGTRMYKELANSEAIKNAQLFLKENYLNFLKAEKKFGVPKEIIASILQVETQCGKNTGDDYIVYWLSRLVSTGFPLNLEYNLRTSKEEPTPTLKELEERANWLAEEFLPHLVSVLQNAKENNSDPYEVKGSKGGAIGMAQFLPKNVEIFGIDGDLNGAINIHSAPDAIFSIANFINKHGWVKNISEKQQFEVLLEYNRSTAYVETVLSLASKLKK